MYSVETQGVVQELDVPIINSARYEPINGSTFACGVYQPFIPILYLMYWNVGVRTAKMTFVPKLNMFEPDEILTFKRKNPGNETRAVNELLASKASFFETPSYIRTHIARNFKTKKQIYQDIPFLIPSPGLAINLNAISTENIPVDTVKIADAFTRSGFENFALRSWRGKIGSYTLAETSYDTAEMAKFHIMAAVLPEDYYYQALHLMWRGSLDLSRVVILVNEELEKKTFINKSLHTIYIGRLKPLIKRTAAKIFLVPDGFIQKTCFKYQEIPKYLTPKDKVRGKESYIEMFKKWMGTGFIALDNLWEPKQEECSKILVQAVEDTGMASGRLQELVGSVPAPVTVRRRISVPGLREGGISTMMATPEDISDEIW